MSEFLSAIPVAASSPFALLAYGIAAIVFVLVGARLRTVKTVIKAIGFVPSKDRRHVIESITNSAIPESISAEDWIRNNKNKSVATLIVTAMILVAVIAVIAGTNSIDPGKAPSPSQAREVSKRWLAIFDSNDFEGSYQLMFSGFKEAHTLESWLAASSTYRRPLGAAQQRLEGSSFPAEFRIGGKSLNAYTIVFFTKFENWHAPIRETVTLVSPGTPDPWKVGGYLVDVPPDAPFLSIRK